MSELNWLNISSITSAISSILTATGILYSIHLQQINNRRIDIINIISRYTCRTCNLTELKVFITKLALIHKIKLNKIEKQCYVFDLYQKTLYEGKSLLFDNPALLNEGKNSIVEFDKLYTLYIKDIKTK